MAFHNISLPETVQYSSTAGAGFATIVQSTASGHEYRVARQAQGRHKFSLVKSLQTEAEAKALKTFALGRRGSLHSFRLKDFSDYTTNADGISDPTATDVAIGTGDGAETTFNLRKTYDATLPYDRLITLPVAGSVVAAVNSVATTSFTINGSGQIVFGSAPADGHTVAAGCKFDVPVRFDKGFDEWAQLRADSFQVWTVADLSCIEVLSEVELPERWLPGGGKNWGAITQNIQLSLNDGAMQLMAPGSAISALLPSVSRIPSGDRVFTLSVAAGSAGSVQLRDDVGTTIGSAISAGTTKFVGLVRGASTSTWVLY